MKAMGGMRERTHKMGLVILALILLAISVGVGLVALLIAKEHYAASPSTRGVVAFMICAVISGLIVLGNWGANFRNDHWQVCTVTGKDRGGDDGSYRIYTKECDTLANKDSLLRGKTNSSNLWAEIEPGHTYRFHIAGSRVPLWSQMANVFEVEKVS